MDTTYQSILTAFFLPSNPTFREILEAYVQSGKFEELKVFVPQTGIVKNDVEIAEKAIDVLNINYLRDRTYTQISGGERQLVLIARALAQQAPILLMDEPTASLDFGNQVMVLSRIQQLANSGLSIIMACHFPEHAFLYANKALLFKQGEVFGFGTPDKVVSKANIKALYGVDVEIAQFHTQQGNAVKMCVPCNLNNNHKISLGRLNHA